MLGTFENKLYELLSGTLSDKSGSKKFFWSFFVFINFTIWFTGLIILYQKKKSQNNINPILPNLNFNNKIHNKPMLNGIHITILLFIVLGLITLFIINQTFQSKGDVAAGKKLANINCNCQNVHIFALSQEIHCCHIISIYLPILYS